MPDSAQQETILKALDSGFTPDQVEKEMIAQGGERTQIIETIQTSINSVSPQLYKGKDPLVVQEFLKSKGFSDAYIPEAPEGPVEQKFRAGVVKHNVPPEVQAELEAISVKKKRENHLENSTIKDVKFISFDNVSNLHAQYENIARKYSTVKSIQAFAGDTQARDQLTKDRAEVNQFIAKGLIDSGVNVIKVVGTGSRQQIIESDDPAFSTLYKNTSLAVKDANGVLRQVDHSFLQDLYASKTELGGALFGAIEGSAATAALVSKVPLHPILKSAIIAGGAFGGSLAGASVGRGLDIVLNAYDTQTELEALDVFDKMADAGLTDAIFTIGGGVALKGIVTTGKAVGKAAAGTTKNIPPTIAKAKSVLVRYMSETEQNLATREWEKLNGLKSGTLSAQEALGVSVITNPKTVGLVAAAKIERHGVGGVLAKQVDDRAKQLLEAVNKTRDPNITRRITEDLTDHISGVKAIYGNVRLEGDIVLKSSGYKFDFDKLITDPISKKFKSTISNPDIVQKVENFLVAASKTSVKRDFKSLLDSRKLVLDLKHELSRINVGSAKVLDDTLKSMDKEIIQVAKTTTEGKEWLKAYTIANDAYGKMLDLKKNVLFKAITKEGVSPDDQIKAYKEFITAEDGTFVALTSKLPKASANKVESEVMDVLIKKFTIGTTNTTQAIDFPLLAKELKRYPFRSKEQKDLKRVVNMMSKVYRADPELATLTGRLVLSNNNMTFAQSVKGKAKQELVNTGYNFLRQFKPTVAGSEATIIRKLGLVLENPLHQKSVTDLLKALPDEQIGKAIKDLQIAVVKEGKQLTADIPRSNIFRAAKVGQEFKVTNGPLGRGIYHTTNKSAAKSSVNEPLKRVTTKEVADYRLASDDMLKEILGDEKLTTSNIKKFSNQIINSLQDKGYVGYKFGDDVLIFE